MFSYNCHIRAFTESRICLKILQKWEIIRFLIMQSIVHIDYYLVENLNFAYNQVIFDCQAHSWNFYKWLFVNLTLRLQSSLYFEKNKLRF